VKPRVMLGSPMISARPRCASSTSGRRFGPVVPIKRMGGRSGCIFPYSHGCREAVHLAEIIFFLEMNGALSQLLHCVMESVACPMAPRADADSHQALEGSPAAVIPVPAKITARRARTARTTFHRGVLSKSRLPSTGGGFCPFRSALFASLKLCASCT
jgi:hypothetical protein